MRKFFLFLLLAAPLRAQVCDGVTDDTLAIQARLNVGGLVTLPEGVCQVSGLVISVDGTTLSGPRTLLRRVPGTYKSLISLPREWTQFTPSAMVRDVRITGITIDGNMAGLQASGLPNYFGIQVIHGERITINDVTIRDQFHEAISVGVGYLPVRDLVISNVRIFHAQRNGIHLGYADGARITNATIENTPSQKWGRAAGNGIDVEVEGLGSYVSNFVIENCTIGRYHIVGAGTAGTGIAFQPAYGPIRFGTVRGNVIRDHQVAIWLDTGNNPATGGVEAIDSITISNNTIFNIANWTDGYGMGANGASNVKFLNNYVYGNDGPGGQPYSLLLRGGHDYTIQSNDFSALVQPTRPYQIGIEDHAQHGATRNVSIRKNFYNRPTLTGVSHNATNVIEVGNIRVP